MGSRLWQPSRLVYFKVCDLTVTLSMTYIMCAAFGAVPSRHVRDPPGGRHTDIFNPDPEDDALSQAPPRPIDEVKIKLNPFRAAQLMCAYVGRP
jgi:hypothetical protein